MDQVASSIQNGTSHWLSSTHQTHVAILGNPPFLPFSGETVVPHLLVVLMKNPFQSNPSPLSPVLGVLFIRLLLLSYRRDRSVCKEKLKQQPLMLRVLPPTLGPSHPGLPGNVSKA